jgi:uncharacterized protein with LGFP repeats
MPKVDGEFAVGPGRLVAFDATTLRELWRDDDDIAFSVFTPPTVANGKVFRATFADELIVYGATPSPVHPCSTIDEVYVNYSAANGIGVPVPGTPAAGVPTSDGAGRFKDYVAASSQSIDKDTNQCVNWGQGTQTIASIYWSQATCAHAVQYGNLALWRALPGDLYGAPGGAERSYLGYPITDELPTPDSGAGTEVDAGIEMGLTAARYITRQDFQNGSIYYSSGIGASHAIMGAIRSKWTALGAEHSVLGLPTSDETALSGATRANPASVQQFEYGFIYWHAPDTEAFEVNGAIYGRWLLDGPAGQPQISDRRRHPLEQGAARGFSDLPGGQGLLQSGHSRCVRRARPHPRLLRPQR